MPLIAYELPGATSTAFLPVPAKYGGGTAYAYKQDTEGQPGTRAVPAPVNTGPGADGRVFLGGGPSNSSRMPAAWNPTLYYQRGLPAPDQFPAGGGYGGPSIYSDNQMPIPARGWGGTSFATLSSVAMTQGTTIGGKGPGIVKGRGGIMLGQNPIQALKVTPAWATAGPGGR